MVRNNFLQSRGGNDQRQASAAELAGIAHRHRALRDSDHDPVDLGFQKIGRAQSVVDVEAVHAEKENVGVQSAQRFLRNRSHQRE